jgi:hypothetical protein
MSAAAAATPERIRPNSPAEAEYTLTIFREDALVLLDWERDLLTVKRVLPGDPNQALLRLSRHPALMRRGEKTERRAHPSEIRREKGEGLTLSDEDAAYFERLSRLAVAVGAMTEWIDKLPALQEPAQVDGVTLLIPMPSPPYMTRVENGRVRKRRPSWDKSSAARRLHKTPGEVQTRPWDWPWIYVLRCYLPWRLDLHDGGKPAVREIPEGLTEDPYTRQLIKDRSLPRHSWPRRVALDGRNYTDWYGPCDRPLADDATERADRDPTRRAHDDFTAERAIDGLFAHWVIEQLSDEDRRWLGLRQSYSPEQAAFLLNLGAEAGWQRDKRLRDRIEQLEEGWVARRVFTKSERNRVSGIPENQAMRVEEEEHMSTAAAPESLAEWRAEAEQRLQEVERWVGLPPGGHRAAETAVERLLEDLQQETDS